MNRAQRRHRKPNYAETIRQKAREDAVTDAMILLFAIPLKVMHDKYGWGKKRLYRLGELMLEEYDECEDLDEYRTFLREECGFTFMVNK